MIKYDELEEMRGKPGFIDAVCKAAPQLIADGKIMMAALQKIAGGEAGESGCYYNNKANINRAKIALKSIGQAK